MHKYTETLEYGHFENLSDRSRTFRVPCASTEVLEVYAKGTDARITTGTRALRVHFENLNDHLSDRSRAFRVPCAYTEVLEVLAKGTVVKIDGKIGTRALREHFESLNDHLSDRSEMQSSLQFYKSIII